MKNHVVILSLAACVISSQVMAVPNEPTLSSLPICSVERLQELRNFAATPHTTLTSEQVYELTRFVHGLAALQDVQLILQKKEAETPSAGFSDAGQSAYLLGLSKVAISIAKLVEPLRPCADEAARILTRVRR